MEEFVIVHTKAIYLRCNLCRMAPPSHTHTHTHVRALQGIRTPYLSPTHGTARAAPACATGQPPLGPESTNEHSPHMSSRAAKHNCGGPPHISLTPPAPKPPRPDGGASGAEYTGQAGGCCLRGGTGGTAPVLCENEAILGPFPPDGHGDTVTIVFPYTGLLRF